MDSWIWCFCGWEKNYLLFIITQVDKKQNIKSLLFLLWKILPPNKFLENLILLETKKQPLNWFSLSGNLKFSELDNFSLDLKCSFSFSIWDKIICCSKCSIFAACKFYLYESMLIKVGKLCCCWELLCCLEYTHGKSTLKAMVESLKSVWIWFDNIFVY